MENKLQRSCCVGMHVLVGLWNGSGLQIMVCDSGVGDNMAGAGRAPAAEQSKHRDLPPPPPRCSACKLTAI